MLGSLKWVLRPTTDWVEQDRRLRAVVGAVRTTTWLMRVFRRLAFGAYLIPEADVEASGLDRDALGRHQIIVPSRFPGYRLAGRSGGYLKRHMPEALPLYRRSANPLRKAWRILDSRGLVPRQLPVLFGAYLIPEADVEASGLDRDALGRHQIIVPSRFPGYRLAGRSGGYLKRHMPEALPLYRRSANPLRKAWRILDSRGLVPRQLPVLFGAYLIPEADVEASGLDRDALGRHQIIVPSRFPGYRLAGRSGGYLKRHMPEALPLYRRSANPLRKAWRILDSRGLVPRQLPVLFGAYLIPEADVEASGLDRDALGRHQIIVPSRFPGYRLAGRSGGYLKRHMPEALPLYRRSANPLRKAWRILDSRGLVPRQLPVLFGAYLIPEADVEASGLDRDALGRHQIIVPSRFPGYRLAGRSGGYLKRHMPEALPLYRRSANPLRKAWRILDSRGLVPRQLPVLFGAYLIPEADVEASGLDRDALGRHQIIVPSRFPGYRLAGRSGGYLKRHMPEALPLYRRSANPLRKAWRILDSRGLVPRQLPVLFGAYLIPEADVEASGLDRDALGRHQIIVPSRFPGYRLAGRSGGYLKRHMPEALPLYRRSANPLRKAWRILDSRGLVPRQLPVLFGAYLIPEADVEASGLDRDALGRHQIIVPSRFPGYRLAGRSGGYLKRHMPEALPLYRRSANPLRKAWRILDSRGLVPRQLPVLFGAYLIPEADVEASGLDRDALGRHQIIVPSRFPGYRLAGRSGGYLKRHMPEALPLYRRSANPLRKAWRILDSRGLVPRQLPVLFGAYLIPEADVEASGLDRDALGRHQIIVPSRFPGYRLAGRSGGYLKRHMPEALPLYRRSANPLRKAWRILDSRGLVPRQLPVLFGAYLIPEADVEASGLDRDALGRHQIIVPSRFPGYRLAGRSGGYLKRHMPEALPLYRRSANPLRKAWRILDSRGLVPPAAKLLGDQRIVLAADIAASGISPFALAQHKVLDLTGYPGIFLLTGARAVVARRHAPAVALYDSVSGPLGRFRRLIAVFRQRGRSRATQGSADAAAAFATVDIETITRLRLPLNKLLDENFIAPDVNNEGTYVLRSAIYAARAPCQLLVCARYQM